MPENCAAIVIAAKHHELFKVKDTRGTTKTVGALRCKFDFRTNDWNNSAKTAMFCNGNVVLHPKLINDAIAVPLDVDNECAVPSEVLDDTLPYSIGVWGVTNSGLRVVSNWLIFNAQIGCYTDGNAPADPEPTLYEQILSIADNAARAAQDLINRANNGEFDGATPYIGENGNWWVAELDTGVRAHGKSAYEVACAHGFEGTSTEWLASLVGATGADGKSAYEVALDGGFKGTQQEWLASLVGEAGVNGKSAYEIAKEHGFNGTEQEWLNSLVGKDGTPGKDGINGKSAYELAKDNGFAGTEQEWLQSLIGKDGTMGVDGKSAYDIAKEQGFKGTESEWIQSLAGKDGQDGYTPIKGVDYFNTTDIQELIENVLKEIPKGDYADAEHEHTVDDVTDFDSAVARKLQAVQPRVSTITCLAENWTGNQSPYSQTVTVSGVTANSKFDLCPTVEQLAYLQDEGISVVVANNEGIVTVYAISEKPTVDLSIQAIMTEVLTNG